MKSLFCSFLFFFYCFSVNFCLSAEADGLLREEDKLSVEVRNAINLRAGYMSVPCGRDLTLKIVKASSDRKIVANEKYDFTLIRSYHVAQYEHISVRGDNYITYFVELENDDKSSVLQKITIDMGFEWVTQGEQEELLGPRPWYLVEKKSFDNDLPWKFISLKEKIESCGGWFTKKLKVTGSSLDGAIKPKVVR